jgi:DnaJ-class molecular chaperone
MESKYQGLLAELEARKCQSCDGSGRIDDAEPGDTSFLEWTCGACRGTGLNDGQAQV